MTWDYWIALYLRTHCTARGLRPLTIAAYAAALKQFRTYTVESLNSKPPDQITASDVLHYLQHLRTAKDNGDSIINRHVVVLKNFYRAIVAMGHLEHRLNPMAAFPSVRGVARKLPVVLTGDETQQLLNQPKADTVIGIRDRAIIALLYATGIRASECAQLRQGDVDVKALTITVSGKGGHQRTIPLNERAAGALTLYMNVRGASLPAAPFFVSRRHRSMSRGGIYERIRSHARKARISKAVSPHRLRHTFATDPAGLHQALHGDLALEPLDLLRRDARHRGSPKNLSRGLATK